jgi:hypothetical protein
MLDKSNFCGILYEVKTRKEVYPTMKKLLTIALIIAMSATFLTACDPRGSDGDPEETTVAATSRTTLEFIGTPLPPPPPAHPLSGQWRFNGDEELIYVFEEGGSGTRSGSKIYWTIEGNLLKVCLTPDSCSHVAECVVPPQTWTFEINDDTLTLTNANNRVFNYSRVS